MCCPLIKETLNSRTKRLEDAEYELRKVIENGDQIFDVRNKFREILDEVHSVEAKEQKLNESFFKKSWRQCNDGNPQTVEEF